MNIFWEKHNYVQPNSKPQEAIPMDFNIISYTKIVLFQQLEIF